MDFHNPVTDASRSFVTPVELAGSRPRHVQLTAGGRALSILAVALFGAAIAAVVLLSGVSARQAQKRDAFVSGGKTTNAEITRLWRTGGEDKKNWVAYRYEADGRSFDHQSRVSSSRWKRLQTGQSLDIRYLRDEPQTSVIVGSEPDALPIFVPYLVGAMACALALLLLRGINCQRRLLSDGRAAAAVVTGIEKHKTSHGGTYRSVKYSFRALSGSVATGKAQTSKKSQEIGSVICVVYDPDRPKKSRPYPFSLVKTARL